MSFKAKFLAFFRDMSILGKVFFYGFLALILCAGIAVGSYFIAVEVKAGKKLGTPSNLAFTQSGPYVFASVDEVVGAKMYLFNIDGQSEIQSTSNVIDLTRFLPEVREYQIKVAVIKQKESSKSEYCETVVFRKQGVLSTPVLEQDDENKCFRWASVANADTYQIIVDGELKGEISTNYYYYSNFSAGEFRVGVVAKDSESVFVDSATSNTKIYTNYIKLLKPAFTKNANKIIINKVANCKIYEVRVDNLNIYQVSDIDDFSTITFNCPITVTASTKIEVRAVGQGYYLSSEWV